MDIDTSVLLYTLSIYAAIVVSPGPNFALISRLALQGRISTSCGAILGLASAATFYALLAMMGLAAILNEIGWLARAVQVLGGLYLMYLGFQSWRTSTGKSPEVENTPATSRPHLQELLSGFKLGAIVNLSNPKGIAFFVGLYAVAVPVDASFATRASVLLGGAAIELVWYGIVVGLFSRQAFQSTYEKFSVLIERVIGSVLILFGGRMVIDK